MTETSFGPPYDAPPIIEAVIQLRYAEPLPKSLYKKLLKRLKREYANELPQITKGASLDFAQEKAAFTAEVQARLSSPDETDVLIVADAFQTWSHLAPYDGWQPFVERCMRDVRIAQEVTGFRKLARIGVRYINRIDIPANEGEVTWYEHYLTINLTLPPMCDTVNSYGWRFERDFADLGLLAIVQSATTAPVIPKHAAFLLDIDVIAERNLPVKVDEIEGVLEKMRNLKNEIFETSITDKARASFSR